MKNLDTRIVVITGGSKGIGRSVAYKFAEEKARIILAHNDADDSASQETLDNLAHKGVEADAHRVDVSSFGAVDLLFKEIFSKFERVDVLINNAGITRDTLLMRMNEEDWDSVLNVNLKGVFNCTRAVVRSMIKERRGRIVNISSVVGQIGNAGQANYS
ncbi:MAG: SDR family NAD(P)-dependent oxidoreductase, partial [Desulfobacteraceae bacterium]|nr:SDR family NAD(P)-dependent oxidoreductase [Desulfobacteraceae bacterium]